MRKKQQQPKKPLLREAKPEKAQHLTKQTYITTGKLRMVTHATGTEEGTAGVIGTGQMTGTKGTDHVADLTGQPSSCLQIFPGAARQQPVTSLQHFVRVLSSASGIMTMICMQGHPNYRHLVALRIIRITITILTTIKTTLSGCTMYAGQVLPLHSSLS